MRGFKAVVVVLLAAAMLVSATLPAGAAGGWRVVPSQSGPVWDNQLYGISCTSTTNCWAVGLAFQGSKNLTLIEHYNGTSWGIAKSPSKPGPLLSSVSCASSTSCIAVGYYTPNHFQTLVEAYNGTTWAIVSSPNTSASQDNFLGNVTCTSTADCWAVGSYNDGTTYQNLIEHYNGTAWSIVSSPDTSSSQSNGLNSVSCSSSTSCVAAGSYNNGTNLQTLVEQFNGTSWSIAPSANTSASQDNQLNTVTCVSNTRCTAAGYFVNGTNAQTLVEQYNGTSWSIAGSPNTGSSEDNVLSAVACTSNTSCWAAGYHHTAGGDQTLVERYNGTSWSITSSPNKQANRLNGIACASTTSCQAVGSYLAGTAGQTLVERYNGISWTIINSPNKSTPVINELRSVACTSNTSCWAVGYYEPTTANLASTLVLQLSGTTWNVVNSPSTSSSQDNFLASVTCASPTSCWAAGYYIVGPNTYQTLILGYNGSSWSIVSSPNTSASDNNELFSITCTSITSCWAVGHAQPSGAPTVTLVEHYDGTSWSIVSSPNTSATKSNGLNSVSCPSATSCWATGYFDNGSALQPLIEQYDGTSWTIVNAPTIDPSTETRLDSIACPSTTSCWAVGNFPLFNGVSRNWMTLVEHYDGTSWSIVSSPNTSPTQSDSLYGIACASSNSCYAVGYYNTGTEWLTLVERWDGTSWTIVSSANKGNISNQLSGVTCLSTTTCWAVGSYSSTGSALQTLVESGP